jgi:two-component system, LuxR family, sensor kinase FixL
MTKPVNLEFQKYVRGLGLGGGFVLAYVLASLAARPHNAGSLLYQPWSMAAALSFAFLIRLGPRWFFPAAAAPFLSAILGGSGLVHPWQAAAHALTEAGACALAAYLVRSRGLPAGLDRVRAVAGFLGAVALAAVLIALERTLLAALTSGMGAGDAMTFMRLIAANAVAMVMAPPILLLSPRVISGPMWRPPMTLETLMQVIALGLVSWEVFWRFVNEEIHFFYLIFLPIGWIAMRHGQRGAVSALAAIYLAPLLSDWAVPHHDQAVTELQIRLGALAVTALLLGATVEERRRSEARMFARQAELAHVQRLNVGWEMASALAHELNQPLTAAMNYAQAALRLIAAPEPDLERAARTMTKSLEQIERTGQTIHGLRDFLRKGDLKLGRCAIAAAMDDAMRLVASEANAAGVLLDARNLAALPPVMADKTQIVQVLINLLRNAIQALDGSRIPQAAVIACGRLAGCDLDITVTDNGPGLDPSVLDRLFEPFVTTKTTGMGLGLAISRSIVEAHNGRLFVERPASGGTRFHIILPLAPREATNA